MKTLKIQKNKQLSKVCTFGVGGPARYFFEVDTVEEAKSALAWAQENQLRVHVLGKGSNTLFDDRGFNGIVILNKIDFFEETLPGCFHVGAGYSFSLLGGQTARQGWSGLEFASGIPGSVGGAVYMNAGANGSETARVLVSVDFISVDCCLRVIPIEELAFGYRTSPFQKMRGLITGATFRLTHESKARERQLEIIEYRKKTQPYSDKSAGCVFRNPKEGSAGNLIDKTGLKGLSVGGAKVSEKHANFIVNTGNATSQEILALMSLVQQKVKKQTTLDLESEIRWIPYDESEKLT